MPESLTAAGCAIMMAALVLTHRAAGAQSLHSNPFNVSDGPAVVQNFSGGPVRSLDHEFQVDLYLLEAFDGRRRVDRFDRGKLERRTPWRLYGRLGPLNFQNQLEPQPEGLQFSIRRTGPRLTGKVYLGVYRTFD